MVASQLLDAARAVTLMASSRRADLEAGSRPGGLSLSFPDRPLFGSRRRTGFSKALYRTAASPSGFLIAAFFLAAFTILSPHRATSSGNGLDSLLPHGRAAFGLDAHDAATGGPPSTLVLYDYQGLDEEDADNLRFFLAVGVSPSDGNRYLIVAREQLMPRDEDGVALIGGDTAAAAAAGGESGAQQHQPTPLGPNDVPLPLLDSLAPNVEIVLRPNEGCRSAWGVLGWALSAGVFDPEAYSTFILVDSSVRGPFLPAHWPPLVHWSAALLSRLRGSVHMAGATITTDPTRPGPGAPPAALVRPQPRVRPGLVAFTSAALEAIKAGDPDALRCRDTPEDALYFNEAGANAAVLHAGLNLDCLMLRFQSKDWLDKSSWGWKYSNSDVDSGPFQVMFVPLRAPALSTSRAAVAAHQYSMWTVKALRAAANAEGAAPKPPPARPGAAKPPTVKRVKKATATDKATARLQLDAAAAQAAAMALRQQRQRANTANTEALEEELRIEREADLAGRIDAEDAGELDAWQRAHQREYPEEEEEDEAGEHAPVLRGGEHSEEFGVGDGDEAPADIEEEEEEEGDTGDVLRDFEDNDDGDADSLRAPQLDFEEDGSGGGGDDDEGDFRAPDLDDGGDEGNFRAPDIQGSDDYSGADDFGGSNSGGGGGGGAAGGGGAGDDASAEEIGDVDEDYNPRSHDEEHNPFGGEEEEEEGGEVARRRRSLIDATPSVEGDEGLGHPPNRLNDEA